jgi:hypothetical protein
MVFCSNIVSIPSLIRNVLGHKPSSTNFVVMLDIDESVIIVQLVYDVMKRKNIFCRYTHVFF